MINARYKFPKTKITFQSHNLSLFLILNVKMINAYAKLKEL